MGKPTGFMEFTRELGADRKPELRILDWNEFHDHLTDEELGNQGARCMDCGIPFCHTGKTLAGMASGCPINNLIPEWNDHIYNGRWEEALISLHKTNNFPEFTGRVCPAPCEGACVLGIHEPPVTIKNIENSIIDHAFDKGLVQPNPPKTRTGKKVAVVGSGPAGLAAAAQLNSAGHSVTVYERDDRIGGLLMYGIPNMKLEKWIVQRRVDLLADEGVEFITNTSIGVDITADQLMKDFDAVVLCTGATKPRDLPIPGRDLKGVHFAMEYLSKNTKSLLESGLESKHYENSPVEGFINAEGKKVVVIGGGDTGNDCLGTAMRQNCESLINLEIVPQPPMERAANNPWPQWPKIFRVDYGHEEAAAVFGKDPRMFQMSTLEFVGDDKGNLRAIKVCEVDWSKPVENGPPFSVVPGTEQELKCDLVFLALGFLGPEHIISEQLSLETDARSNFKAEHEQYTTNIEGVFAAGDCRRGQSLIVWAINEGRGAARECDRFLMGETELP
ncbi:Glutamate synthase [NADPH] small chain [Gimesia panareensis]|uniref:Glutamate synthase [NADPH] small chain n=1 Tax=Gimesia panareensis TaxID=2527978 RepID=A0A517Q225_9PLAN|nr:glutamate synthase subunit beta [Gimesia panareensis]QDT25679.1 Glutamate synthase [NADPH] small chain [Gimesia panareensis]